VRSPPADLIPERLAAALAEGWPLHPALMDYVPEGGGSHHWKAAAEDGTARFVTVDDLDDKDWLGDSRDAVFNGLGRALNTATALRDRAGLDFVVAPLAARDGGLLHRVDDRYTVCVFPFLPGRSHRFGPYPDPLLRGRALDMIAALHLATPAVRDLAPRHVPGFTGRDDLDAFLGDPARPWAGGPFSEPARRLLVPCAADLARLAAGFDRLAAATAAARADLVITHGEPHPANLMSVAGRLVLIDWDTAALASPERDVSVIAAASGEGIDRYQQTVGRDLNPAVLTLYRSRWYLDDLGSAIRLFRRPHRDTSDTRLWRDSLASGLEQLPRWLELLS
jgi:spectinomycin phosphotransferase